MPACLCSASSAHALRRPHPSNHYVITMLRLVTFLPGGLGAEPSTCVACCVVMPVTCCRLPLVVTLTRVWFYLPADCGRHPAACARICYIPAVTLRCTAPCRRRCRARCRSTTTFVDYRFAWLLLRPTFRFIPRPVRLRTPFNRSASCVPCAHVFCACTLLPAATPQSPLPCCAFGYATTLLAVWFVL